MAETSTHATATPTMPRIGDPAPAFTAVTTQGDITCVDWFFCTRDVSEAEVYAAIGTPNGG